MNQTITWKCLKCGLACEVMEEKSEYSRVYRKVSLCCKAKVRMWEKK